MPAPDNTLEKFRDQFALTIILVVAACARFYSLDQNGLSATEISNLLACDVRGWFPMVSYYVGNSGMPPFYPTLLCQLTDWTANTDFFVRALSALAGTVSVYIAYLMGKQFFSMISGLLAAAIIATDFQMLIVDRTAVLYSPLGLMLVLNSYFFCRLLIERDGATSRNIAINITGDRWGLQWSWEPNFTCDARFLLGFWISGALAFYTSPFALIVLMLELVATFFLVDTNYRRIALKTLWLPLLIVMLPWLPKFYGLSQWVIEGNLFGIQPLVEILRKVQILLPIDPFILKIQIFLAIAAILIFSMQTVRKKYRHDQIRFLQLIIFQLTVAAIAFFFIPASDSQSYIYFRWCLIILLAAPAAALIELLPFYKLKNSLIFLFVIGIMLFQVSSNATFKLYTRGGDAGFALAANIIIDDDAFMAGNKKIVTSTTLFENYLDNYGAISKNSLVLTEENTKNLGVFLDDTSFYYLEYSGDDKDFVQEYPLFIALSQQYKVLCATQVPRFRITKFSIDHASSEPPTVDCRSHLSGQRGLK